MIYKEEKSRLFRELVNNHVQEKDFDYYAIKVLGIAVPKKFLARWKEKFYHGSIIKNLPSTPRLINRFTMGADPEYALIDSNGTYTHAFNFGLSTMEACGADLSGRQMELRTAPSRFVLDIIASILDTLRWQVVKYPATRAYKWNAIGYIQTDGFGGHVHFARKNTQLSNEIKSLDSMAAYMSDYRFLPGAHDRSVNSNYGRPGDYRKTSYGYEHRTLSTWLNTPFTAYLSMVAAKLAIYHNWVNIHKENNPFALENLLAAYQYQDDDAAIALHGLRIRKQRQAAPNIYALQDMRYSWGLLNANEPAPRHSAALLSECRKEIFIPPSIKPNEKTRQEVFNYLINAKPLSNTIHSATWTPSMLKKDESALEVTQHVAGLPEVAQGLISKGVRVRLTYHASNNEYIGISLSNSLKYLVPTVRKNLSKLGVTLRVTSFSGDVDPVMYCSIQIPMNTGIRGNRFIVAPKYIQKWREVLLSIGLPIVEYEKYHTLQAPIPIKVKERMKGKLIFQSE